jgi:hypothetical protein
MSEPVYEMVWDCRYCGAQKLLGLTHRHCPNCGAAQDPNARYFPADHEKVAVENHAYVGADMQCGYCGAASSRRAHNCGRCGAALVEGAEVQRHGDTGAGILLPSSPATPPPRPAWKILLPTAALLLVAVTVVLLVWKKDQTLVVAGHSWRRTVNIERFAPVTQSAWCDELPSGASDVTRRREQRGSKRVADGEDCQTRKKDRGDGTFAEERECTARFKEEPVFDQKCAFSIVKWSAVRQEVAQARGLAAPRWPTVTLARPGCSGVGCEREGARSEQYTVLFRDAKGQEYRCDLDEKAWSGYVGGRRYAGKLHALTGSLDCGSLRGGR